MRSARATLNQSLAYQYQSITDIAFLYTKSLLKKLNNTILSNPILIPSLKLCNGMDVINRTVFNHYHAWNDGPYFNLNIRNHSNEMFGIPYMRAVCLKGGGRPESMDADELKLLRGKRLYFNNIHYQGTAKEFLTYDLCRILNATNDVRYISERNHPSKSYQNIFHLFHKKTERVVLLIDKVCTEEFKRGRSHHMWW